MCSTCGMQDYKLLMAPYDIVQRALKAEKDEAERVEKKL